MKWMLQVCTDGHGNFTQLHNDHDLFHLRDCWPPVKKQEFVTLETVAAMRDVVEKAKAWRAHRHQGGFADGHVQALDEALDKVDQ